MEVDSYCDRVLGDIMCKEHLWYADDEDRVFVKDGSIDSGFFVNRVCRIWGLQPLVKKDDVVMRTPKRNPIEIDRRVVFMFNVWLRISLFYSFIFIQFFVENSLSFGARISHLSNVQLRSIDIDCSYIYDDQLEKQIIQREQWFGDVMIVFIFIFIFF